MKLVEVVRTIFTDEEVYEQASEFGKKLGKVPVRASDKTGFIVNRLLVPYMLDAIRALEEGVGSIVDIDNAMKLGWVIRWDHLRLVTLSDSTRPTTSLRSCSMSFAKSDLRRRRY